MASKIDFYGLTRPVQERFAAATRLRAPPTPLLVQPASRALAWGLLCASAALIALEFWFVRLGWGDVQSSLAIHGSVARVIDIALVAAAAYAALRAVGIVLTLEGRPWRPGTYLFPGCVIIARGPELQVWPMADLQTVERAGSPLPALALRMRDGARVVVRAASVKQLEKAEAGLESARSELSRAMGAGDVHALAELDPLHDLTMSSPIGPTAKMRPNVPLWVRLDWAIAAALGVLLGYAICTMRNTLSDNAMFKAVIQVAAVQGYTQYLARGGTHTPEVRDVLLPRAQLRDAEATGSVGAVQAFAQAHPSSKIDTEIAAALRRTTLADLDKAKKMGTVSGLDAFARTHPGHIVDAELKAARHGLFVKALAAWKASARPDAATGAFMERLIAWAEKTGQGCSIRFRLKPASSMDDADKVAMSSGHFPGTDALPSHFVTADALRPREVAVQDALVQAFTAAFPADMLAVRGGEALAVDAPVPTDVPTLVVDYSPEWSHANTVNAKPSTVFAGIIFSFDASFTLGDAPPWKLALKAWRGAEAWKVKNEDLTREEFEQKVYDSMIDGAFDQLQKKMLDVLF